MKSYGILISLLVVLVLLPLAGAQDEAAKQQAHGAGEQWLAAIDGGKYAESYDAASAQFKGAITKERWVSALKGARDPLGAMVTRKLASAKFATSLPGAPDGEYVVMQFNASFQNKKEAVETLTMTRDKDGQWRAAGYFIR